MCKHKDDIYHKDEKLTYASVLFEIRQNENSRPNHSLEKEPNILLYTVVPTFTTAYQNPVEMSLGCYLWNVGDAW